MQRFSEAFRQGHREIIVAVCEAWIKPQNEPALQPVLPLEVANLGKSSHKSSRHVSSVAHSVSALHAS